MRTVPFLFSMGGSTDDRLLCSQHLLCTMGNLFNVSLCPPVGTTRTTGTSNLVLSSFVINQFGSRRRYKEYHVCITQSTSPSDIIVNQNGEIRIFNNTPVSYSYTWYIMKERNYIYICTYIFYAHVNLRTAVILIDRLNASARPHLQREADRPHGQADGISGLQASHATWPRPAATIFIHKTALLTVDRGAAVIGVVFRSLVLPPIRVVIDTSVGCVVLTGSV